MEFYMQGLFLILAFFVALAFIVISIVKFKLHPFLALLLGALLMGVSSGMPLADILANIGQGFGGIMSEIGIIVFLGVILGQILHDSGCTRQIAHKMLSIVGAKKAPTAINLTGYIISIPVFFDVAFIILISLLKQLSKEGKLAFNALVTALVVGLMVTHAMVIPTPAPVAVAGQFKANIGWFIVYGMLISLPASLVAGVLYTKWLGSKRPVWVRDPEYADTPELDTEQATPAKSAEANTNTSEESADQPSGTLGILYILLPILLIILAKIVLAFIPEGTTAHNVTAFLGDTVIILLFTVFVVFLGLKRFLRDSFDTVITEATTSVGVILAIIGAGGAFGTVISATGLGDDIVTIMHAWNMPIMFLGFLLAMFLHAGLGSVTVALVTSAAVVQPIAMQMGVDPILCGLAICAGGMGMGLPSDSGFWTVSRFSQFTTQETFWVYTIPLTIASFTAMAVIACLSFFSAHLPGLM